MAQRFQKMYFKKFTKSSVDEKSNEVHLSLIDGKKRQQNGTARSIARRDENRAKPKKFNIVKRSYRSFAADSKKSSRNRHGFLNTQPLQISLDAARHKVSEMLEQNLNITIPWENVSEYNIERYCRALRYAATVDCKQDVSTLRSLHRYREYLKRLCDVIKRESKFQISLIENFDLLSGANLFVSIADVKGWLRSLEAYLEIGEAADFQESIINIAKYSQKSNSGSLMELLKVAKTILHEAPLYYRSQKLRIIKPNEESSESVVTENILPPFKNVWQAAESLEVIMQKTEHTDFDFNSKTLEDLCKGVNLIQFEIQDNHHLELDQALLSVIEKTELLNSPAYIQTIKCPTLSFLLNEILDVFITTCAKRAPAVIL
jgi:hypothetical protein